MEVVQRTDDGPFGRRDVEEWSRLDQLTGMLEHARVQTDRWAGVDSLGGSHKYGKKVVDATKTGGAGQHRQRQQLEVFQSRVPGGAMQVIRSQTASSWSQQGPSRLAATKSTVSSSSTSSRTRWSSRSTAGGSTIQDSTRSLEPAENFANLELALNPIDVSSLKMKACVGRSGSIGGRRPPSTRSRRLSASGNTQELAVISTSNHDDSDDSSPTNHHLTELSRMCQKVHEEQKRRFDGTDDEDIKLSLPLGRRFSKSSSTDDIPAEIVARDEQDEGMSSWRRGARVRRSLQFSSRDGDRASGVCVPVPATKRHSFVTVDSLREVRGRLRHLTSDQVEKSGIKNGVLKIPDYRRADDDHDDGIASEETAAESDSPVNTLRGCKTYCDPSAPPATSSGSAGQQTGSLESRSSRATAAARSDEWFNRRKSYGFEQVHNQSSERGSRITEGKKTESSDSGISRSTEIVPANNVPASWGETSKSTTHEESEHVRKKTIVTLNAMNAATKWNEKAVGDVSPTRRRFSESSAFFRNVTTEAQTAARRANAAPKPTTITIPIVFQQEIEERKKFSMRQLPEASRVFSNGVSTSPTPDPETLGWASRRQLDGLGPAKRRSWAGDSPLLSHDHSSNYNSDCDDIITKINRTNTTISLESTNSGDFDADDASTISAINKKTKRVEFCKTEVHFAAESGRFHIIETDEKPPPSNNFRRRRRSQPTSSNNTANSTTATNTPAASVVAQKPPLPELRFGDSVYEKKMLMTNSQQTVSTTPAEPKEVNVPIQLELEDSGEKGDEEHIFAVANTTIISGDISSEDSGRNTDSEDNRSRAVYKRMSLDESEAKININKEDSKAWGVKLRPIGKVESVSPSPVLTSSPVAPVWRSTVTLRNQTTEENTSVTSSPGQMELQKLLRSLRPASSPQRHSLDLSSSGSPVIDTVSAWSVAERIRQAEERKSRGFSTKVNLGGAGETTVLQSSDPVWLGEPIRESSPVREPSSGTTLNEPPAVQMSAATFSVPSYSSSSTCSEQQSRLLSVDTLVSTRSGAPRITSISLHYDGESEKKSNPGVTKPLPSKTVTNLFSSSRPSVTSNSNRSVTSISSRLTASSPVKQDDIRPSPTKINLSSITRTSLSPSNSSRTSLSPMKSSGLPPRGSSPCRRSVSPARSPHIRVPITAPTRRVSSPCEPTRKTTPQQTFFGAEVLEVEPRPEDRRGEDEIVSTRTTVTEKTSVRPLSSYRSSSRGRLPEYSSSVSKPTPTGGNTDGSRARSLSPVKRLNKLVIGDNPIYQNQAAISATTFFPAETAPKSSAALIEELTRAADEILQAVNGYSDDSAASSDEEKQKTRLSALREGEVSRTEERTPRKKTVAASSSRLKKKVGPTSSTSSVESISKEQRVVKRTPLPGVRSSHISTRPAVPIPGSPIQSVSDESASGRRVRTTRRRATVTTPTQQATKEEEEATKARERIEARAERLRSSRPRRPRTTTRQAEEVAASGKRVLVPDLSKSRAPMERIIPAAPRKSPSKPRREEHHQLTRTANGATAERRLQLIESGTSSSSRTCGTSASASGIGGRVKSRGEGLKIASK